MGHCESDLQMKKKILWPADLDITTIMALPLLRICTPEGHIRAGASRLFLIIMSESAFLIWKLRCKRILDVTPEDPIRTISLQEAHNQASAIINSRLNQDKILTRRKRYAKKS